jgi:hypothetical protein
VLHSLDFQPREARPKGQVQSTERNKIIFDNQLVIHKELEFQHHR